MSFEKNIDKSVTHPIVLFEYDLPVDLPQTINYEPGIWFTPLSPGTITVTDDYGVVAYYENTNEVEYNIQSLKVGSSDYTKVDSIAALRIQDSSFYFERSTSNLYIHFVDFEPVLDKDPLIGSVTGYCTEEDRTRGSYYNSVYYEPRIKNVPSLNVKKDPLFFGKISFNSGNISFLNNDGHFDNFDEGNPYRQAGRLLFGFEGEEYPEYKQVFSGYLENYNRDFVGFGIAIQDIRKSLSRPIPPNRFSIATYPSMDDSNDSEPIPLTYGYMRKAPVICTNELAAPIPANYEFLISDTTYHNIHSIVEIWDGEDGEVSGDITWSIDLTTGILSIDSGDINNISDIWVTFYGYKDSDGDVISNALDIIKDLMFYYGDIAYIAANFNLLEWSAATLAAVNAGYFINEDEELIDVIGKIISDAHGIFYSQIDGKYSAKIWSSTRTPVKTIYNYEWIGSPKIENNGSQFLSSVLVKYNEDIAESEFLTYLNTDYEDTAVDRYKSYQQKEYEVKLYNEADATAFSNLVLEQSSYIRDVVVRKVKMSHYDLELGDFIIANPDVRPDGTIDDFGVWEIIGKSINFNKFEISLTMKYIKDYVETTILYTQGWLLQDKMLNDKMFSETTYEEV